MIRIEATPLVLPDELQDIYERAKSTYVSGKHRDALDINQQLLDRATAAECRLGKIIGRRFIGLCEYRLSMLEKSRESFEAALKLAEEAGNCAMEQQLLLRNHLAATMRRLGRLEDAHELLDCGLEMATLEQYPHAHARLLGNMGALLDELGQRAAADDCYARFEVLERLLGNEHRLANAVGLAARSAEFRGDLDRAEKKYAEEAHLAAKVGDPLRQIAAKLHHARMADCRKRTKEAEELFQEALHHARRVGHEKRYVDALEAYANFLRTRHDLPTAHRLLHEALAMCKEPEKQANVNHSLALVCRDAGLYGESLFHLMRSVDERSKIYEPLRRLRKLAQTRLDGLKDLTNTLVDEAFLVSRSADVEATLQKLVNDVHGRDTAWKEYVSSYERRTADSPRERDKRLHEESLAIWSEKLLRDEFARMSEQSRGLLLRAERSYSSTVDDLGRSAHLLALVVERELKEHVFDGIKKERPCDRGKKKDRGGHWTLGSMLEVLNCAITTAHTPSSDDMRRLYDHIRAHRPIFARICDAREVIKPLEGKPRALVEVRNGVAHGDEEILASLDRLQVDAIKRHLALEAPEGHPTILQALAQLRHLPP